MANTVKIKQSSVAAKVPTTAQLVLGELAINTNDGKLYLKKSVSSVESIVEVSGDKQATSDKDASGGYAGLTLFKLNLRNAANTITSWFTTAATVARTWTMPDKDGTVAMTSDITATAVGLNNVDNTSDATKNAATATLTNKTLTAPLISQVVFPATQVASSDPNTLDDYEEGTWTPVFTCNTPGDLSVSYGTQVGRYTKIGRQVTLTCSIAATITHTTASSIVKITGVPTAFIGLGSQFGAIGAFAGMTDAGYTSLGAQMAQTAEVYITRSGSGLNFSNSPISSWPSGGTIQIYFVFTYFV